MTHDARPVTLDGTLSDDAYHRLTELVDVPSGVDLSPEGLVQAQVNGLTVRMGDQTKPSDDDAGTELADGQTVGWGPSPRNPFPLDEIWVRNTVDGSNARVIFQGLVR